MMITYRYTDVDGSGDELLLTMPNEHWRGQAPIQIECANDAIFEIEEEVEEQ
jgi:hypothetical protein